MERLENLEGRGASLCPRVHQLGRLTGVAGRTAHSTHHWFPRRFMRCRRCSSPLTVFFCPSPCLAPQNSSHQTPNVENDPPQGLSPSNPPSLSSGSFRCARAYFRKALESRAQPASVLRLDRKGLGGADTGPPPLASLRHSRRCFLQSINPSGQGCRRKITSFRSRFGQAQANLKALLFTFFLRLTQVIVYCNKDGSSGFTKEVGNHLLTTMALLF